MLELVTLEECYSHLRLDEVDSNGSPDDPWLQVFIPAISQAVALWLKSEARLYIPELDSNGDVVFDSNGNPVPELDSNGQPTPMPVVRAAVLIEIAKIHKEREGEGVNYSGGDAGYGYTLSPQATNLLTPLRKPTVA